MVQGKLDWVLREPQPWAKVEGRRLGCPAPGLEVIVSLQGPWRPEVGSREFLELGIPPLFCDSHRFHKWGPLCLCSLLPPPPNLASSSCAVWLGTGLSLQPGIVLDLVSPGDRCL